MRHLKACKICQAATAYDNPETGETTILILNEAIWMGDRMDHTLINLNQLWAYGLTVQYSPFSDSPIFISTEANKFVLPLSSKGTILGVTTRTQTEAELQRCPHVLLLSEHEWDPQNVCFPKALRAVKEEVSRTVRAVPTKEEYNHDESNNDTENRLLDIGELSQRLIAHVKVTLKYRKLKLQQMSKTFLN